MASSSAGPSSSQSYPVIVNKKLVSLISNCKQINIVTTYAEVLDGLRLYIMQKKLFDPNFPVQIRCAGDELSSILGVEEFTIHDVRKLLQKHVFPIRINRTQSQRPMMPTTPTLNDTTASKRKAEELANEGGVKRSCDDVQQEVTTLYTPSPFQEGTSSNTTKNIQEPMTLQPSSSSKEEMSSNINIQQEPVASHILPTSDEEASSSTTENIQEPITDSLKFSEKGISSNTTENIKTSDTTLNDASDDSWSCLEDESDDDLLPGDIVAVEEIFDVEYDVESDSEPETNAYLTDSDSDLDIRDTTITFICKPDSDIEFFADESHEENSESDLEMSPSDKWKCKRCNGYNSPQMRHCIKCWCERPGWLNPKRSEQRLPSQRKRRNRHRKKEEKTVNTEKEDSPCCSTSFVNSVFTNTSETEKKTNHKNQELSAVHQSIQGESNFSFESGFVSDELPSSSMSSSNVEKVPFNYSDVSCSSQDFSCSSSHEYPSTSSGTNSQELSNDINTSLNSFRTLNLSSDLKSDSDSNICLLCHTMPANASIIHGKYAHQFSCYRCARNLQKEDKRCPVCLRSIDRVVYQITAV